MKSPVEVSVPTEINRHIWLSKSISSRGLRTYGDKPDIIDAANDLTERSPWIRR